MKTASTEREAIVAYLRGRAKCLSYAATPLKATALTAFKMVKAQAEIADLLADAIENGAHIKDQDHGRA